MPVLIAAPAGQMSLVQDLASRLKAEGGEVRCYLEEDAGDLRSIGCKIAVGSLDDEMNLEASLTNVHTFIPLLPDPALVEAGDGLLALERFGAVAAAAAGAAGIEQTILPLPGLAGGPHALGEAYGKVAAVFAAACRPLCVLRTGLAWGRGRPFTDRLRRLAAPGAALPGGGTARLSVVPEPDLAALVAAADDREDVDGVWEFGGMALPLAELVALAGPGPGPGPGPWLAEVLAAGLVVGRSAEEEFGVAAGPPGPAGI